jgi:hypothetical protein
MLQSPPLPIGEWIPNTPVIYYLLKGNDLVGDYLQEFFVARIGFYSLA